MTPLRIAQLVISASVLVTPYALAGSDKVGTTFEEVHATRISAMEKETQAWYAGGSSEKRSLSEWMRDLRVPGLSIALIDDHKIAWVRAYGVSENSTESLPLTPRTMLQAASIAKPVTAVATLHQVDAGLLSLDVDVNRYLRSWKVPDSDEAGGVTLRQLLAHTAGITPGGFAGYRRGEPLPTTVQILRGERPANNVAAKRVSPIDESVEYSGLGYTVIELALSEELGIPFRDLVKSTVFEPLSLIDTQLSADLTLGPAEHAAAGHRPNGSVLDGAWMVNPELAAAGLWTTPGDLARFAIEIAKAWNGEPTSLLSSQMAREMLKPHRARMGLGFNVRPEQPGWFSHSGGNLGYRAYFEMDAVSGDGIVVMTNSDVGQLLIALVTRAVAREYARDIRPLSEATSAGIAEQLSRQDVQRTELIVESKLLKRFIGRYVLQPDMVFEIDMRDGLLGARLSDQPRFALKAESETTFYFENVEAQITFVTDASGDVTGLVLHQGGRDLHAKRLSD